jgi:hypothetical protein
MAWHGTREGRTSEWGRKDRKEVEPHLRGTARRWAIADQGTPCVDKDGDTIEEQPPRSPQES